MKSADAGALAPIPGARVLIVAAPYYRQVTDWMAASAEAHLTAAGASCSRIEVPGAFELPTAIALEAKGAAGWDGYLALGCVVRGATSHDDYVCGESARALMDLGVRDGLAIGYGVLTVESLEQAEERADPARRDKGGEASRAVAALIALKRRLAGRS